jgi:hypothetical protein
MLPSREGLDKLCPECVAPFSSSSVRNNQELIRCMRIIASQSVNAEDDSATSLQISLPSAPPTSAAKKSANSEQAPMCQFCDDAPATSVCQDCSTNKNLCDDCHLVRHKKESMQGHTRVPWSAKITNPMCVDHNHECLMYCRDDHSAICTLCTFGTHKGHDVVLTFDEAAACKERLKTAVAELEDLTQEVQTAGLKISERFEQITGRSPLDTSKMGAVSHGGGTSYAAIIEINRHFDHLIDSMQRRRRELIDQVHAISAEKSGALMEQIDANSIYVARNYSVCYNIRRCLEQESDVNLLRRETELLSSIYRQVELRENVFTEPATSIGIRFMAPTDSGFEDTIHTLGSVAAVEVDAKRCTFANSEILRSLVVDDEISLSLQLLDRSGQPMSAGGEDVSCEIHSVSSGAVVSDVASVVDCGDGSYNIMVRFGAVGEYAMGVSVGGIEMTGSPFAVSVSHYRRLRKGFIGGGRGSEEGQFNLPDSICYDNGLLYVSDQCNHRVQVFSCDGTYVRSIGGGRGSGEGQFNCPSGICCDNGLLYVSDLSNHRVQVFSCDGTYVRSIGGGEGSGEGQLDGPDGICCDNGLLYVSDIGNDRVQAFSCDGTYVRSIGGGNGSGEGQFKSPSGICCYNGLLYVSDFSNYRVQVFSCDGTYVRSIGGG